MIGGATDANIRAVITAKDEASSVINNFGKNVDNTAEAARNVANKAAIALGVAGAGLTLLAKNATDFTVQFVKGAENLARQTGDTVQEASRLLYVTQRLGIDADKTSQYFGIYSKNIANSNKAFQELGVSLKNVDGTQRKFDQILLDTADKFKEMPNGIQKTALSLELFGRSGKDMIKVLNLGSQGILELEQQADKLGLTLTTSNANQIQKYIESQKNLKDSTNVLKLAIGETTAPVLTEFNNRINDIILSLLSTDSPVRGLTANVLAFGGPALTFSGAAIGIAANLTTIASEAGAARAAIASLQLTAALGIVIPVAAALVALDLVYQKGQQTLALLDKITGQQQNILSSNTKAYQEIRDAEKAGKISHARATQLFQQLDPYARASGGPVTMGTPYLVGEQGPELMIPNQSGKIVNAKDTQGMMSNTGFGQLNITLQAGAFMGNPQDARQYAKLILNSLQDVASSKGMSFDQLWRHNGIRSI